MSNIKIHRDILWEMMQVLDFYSDPETYFAIGFFPDPPCGPFIDDFSETDMGTKPGKRAREIMRKLQKHIEEQEGGGEKTQH